MKKHFKNCELKGHYECLCGAVKTLIVRGADEGTNQAMDKEYLLNCSGHCPVDS